MLGAFCLTEPHVGSRCVGAAHHARARDGDDYVLNGVKQFITSGKNGRRRDRDGGDRQGGRQDAASAPSSCRPTTPGYIVARLEEKTRASTRRDTAQILFENCRVPAENLIGERRRRATRSRCRALEGGRIGIASQASAWRAPRSRRRWPTRRSARAFGKPIFEHQAVQFRLADMATQIEAARQLI